MTSAGVLEFDCQFKYPHGFALDFQFIAGDGITALVGPSGVGKTTVLNLIAGLLNPQTGHITLRDHTLFDSKSGVDLPPERRDVGYVFQDYQLFPHLTVRENLRYGERRKSTAVGEARGNVSFDKTIAVLELTDLLSRYPATLSGGQKQRVAIGRALLRSPKLLLLDEPLNAVHWQMREEVLVHLREIADEFRLPTLLVSHDRPSVAKLSDATVELVSLSN